MTLLNQKRMMITERKERNPISPKKMFLVCCCQKQKVLYTSCQRYLTFFEICGGIVRVSCCNFFPRKMVVFIRNDMRSRVVQHNIELFKKGARLKFAACIVHFHDGKKKRMQSIDTCTPHSNMNSFHM